MIPKQPGVPARAARRIFCKANVWTRRLLGTACAGFCLAISASVACAQIRDNRPIRQSGSQWWFSGGASAVTLGAINDGATNARWDFGSDPLWQVRGTLEKSSDEYTSLGVSAAYGRVDVALEPLSLAAPVEGSGLCATACRGEVDLWTAQLQFRSGGGTGFHTVFEAQGGVTAFRNLRRKETGEAIGEQRMQADISGTLGAGFGYTISRGLAISLVQDFGIGWHSKTDLPEGTSRTWKVRVTRASLRFAL